MIQHADKVFILKPDGSEVPLVQWQQSVGLSGAKIGKYFSFTEAKFTQDIQDYGKIVVCELLIKVLDRYRELKGKSVRINSFNRSHEKQLSLQAQGFKAAQYSPHEVFLAADCDTDTEEETRDNVALIKQASNELGIKVRIGFEEYLRNKQTFIHVDVCPEYFGHGKTWYLRPHPVQWETSITW